MSFYIPKGLRAIIHGDAKRHLDFNQEEHPIVLQLGGSNPQDLATCTKMAQDWGYNEVNLNVGCPSDRYRIIKCLPDGLNLIWSQNVLMQCVMPWIFR